MRKLKGKWAQGIEPRNFKWVLKDKMAVCERPGGIGSNHRRVRRQEEIIWIRENGFDQIVSLIPATHNLHNYDELGMPWRHLPFVGAEIGQQDMATLHDDIERMLGLDSKIIVHREELGDHVAGFMAGYLIHAGLIDDTPKAVVTIEQLLERQLGPAGRELVNLAAKNAGLDSIA
ncbi:MAG: hypothetical protein V3V01_11435 [Acidimicrobiales bacterium]